MVKDLISNTLGKWWRTIPISGSFRFKIMYWAYRLTGWHIRHREWDFVLDYLPKLGKWQNVYVLDVGTARTLFCHELVARGYRLVGVDLEQYRGRYPGYFVCDDIRNKTFEDFDFVVCISVLEHIEFNQSRALESMVNSLRVGGRLILTIPTREYAQGHPWHGFSWQDLYDMLDEIEPEVGIVEQTERMGQLCVVLERLNGTTEETI